MRIEVTQSDIEGAEIDRACSGRYLPSRHCPIARVAKRVLGCDVSVGSVQLSLNPDTHNEKHINWPDDKAGVFIDRFDDYRHVETYYFGG